MHGESLLHYFHTSAHVNSTQMPSVIRPPRKESVSSVAFSLGGVNREESQED
jgi:hypothetical protein